MEEVENEEVSDEYGCAILILVIPVVIVSVLFLLFLDGYLSIRDFDSWPTVTGWIVKSGMEKSSNRYSPDITYRYQIDDHTYYGTYDPALGPGTRFDSKAIKAIVDRLPVGQGVKVHYSPRRPQLSYLEPPPQMDALGSAVLSGVVLLFFSWLLVRELARRAGWIPKGRSGEGQRRGGNRERRSAK